jgi:hypothetical protein
MSGPITPVTKTFCCLLFSLRPFHFDLLLMGFKFPYDVIRIYNKRLEHAV